MNWNQLRFVRAVVDAGTFTGGAERCHVTQSTLSSGIALLEKELGERLFVRTTRSVSLTPFGRRLLPLIDDVLSAQAALLDVASGYLDPDAKLARLGVCPLVDASRLGRLLAPYREANRSVRVVFEQLDGVDPRTALEDGRFDFMLGPTESRRVRLERSPLYEDLLVYLPAANVGPYGADRRPVRLHDIADDEFLLVHDACGLTSLTRQLFRTRHLPLKEYEGQAVSYQVLEEWARVGIGSAILPQSKLSSPDLGHPIVLGNGHPAVIRFEALWSPATAKAPHVQALARHLRSAGALVQ
jgi:LysR family transcriptional regulator, hydrogen peroxide-inducible genes activator